eukprot:gene25081-biopygen8989
MATAPTKLTSLPPRTATPSYHMGRARGRASRPALPPSQKKRAARTPGHARVVGGRFVSVRRTRLHDYTIHGGSTMATARPCAGRNGRGRVPDAPHMIAFEEADPSRTRPRPFPPERWHAGGGHTAEKGPHPSRPD